MVCRMLLIYMERESNQANEVENVGKDRKLDGVRESLSVVTSDKKGEKTTTHTSGREYPVQ